MRFRLKFANEEYKPIMLCSKIYMRLKQTKNLELDKMYTWGSWVHTKQAVIGSRRRPEAAYEGNYLSALKETTYSS